MANLQKALEALQPYVISIRYVNGVPVVDTLFKEGWTLPDSDVIKRLKGDESVNYHMIFSEQDGIGLDELLEYVSVTIQTNIEREKKLELLKEKINELKVIFKKNSLSKLKRLKFGFDDENLIPEVDEFDLDEIDDVKEKSVPEIVKQPIVEEPEVIVNNQITEPLTEEEREMLEEEKRADNFRRLQELTKQKQAVKTIQKVELPPRNRQSELVMAEDTDCNCGPHEACNKCMDSKDL